MRHMLVDKRVPQYMVTVEDPGYRVRFMHSPEQPTLSTVMMCLALHAAENSNAGYMFGLLEPLINEENQNRTICSDIHFGGGFYVRVQEIPAFSVRVTQEVEDA